MTGTIIALASSALGAFIQELAHWHVLRKRLSKPQYQETFHSAGYWIVTLLMILASSLGSWLWFLPEVEAPRTYLLTGAAFPMLVKRAIAAFLGDESKLGKAPGEKASIREGLRGYFTAA